MTIGERIKKRRREKRISVDKLAELVGVSRSTIFRYENGSISKLPIDTLRLIAQSLDAEIEYFVDTEIDCVDVNHNLNVEHSSNIAERLKEYRTNRGLSLSDMEHLTGIPAQTLNRYELGQRSPKLNTAIAIAEALNVHPMWLQGYDVSNPNVFDKTELPTCAECALHELIIEVLDVFKRLSPQKQKEALNYLRYLESIE